MLHTSRHKMYRNSMFFVFSPFSFFSSIPDMKDTAIWPYPLCLELSTIPLHLQTQKMCQNSLFFMFGFILQTMKMLYFGHIFIVWHLHTSNPQPLISDT